MLELRADGCLKIEQKWRVGLVSTSLFLTQAVPVSFLIALHALCVDLDLALLHEVPEQQCDLGIIWQYFPAPATSAQVGRAYP